MTRSNFLRSAVWWRWCTGRGATAALLLTWLQAAGCSVHNQDGPEVTCADLDCGRINACRDGIIAQCLDGVTVRYHVCASGTDDICDDDWQIPGQYRCSESTTDCEGCRPERTGCPTGGAGGGSGSGGAGG